MKKMLRGAVLAAAGLALATQAPALAPPSGGRPHQAAWRAGPDSRTAPELGPDAPARLAGLSVLEEAGAEVRAVRWGADGNARLLRGRLSAARPAASAADAEAIARDFLRANHGLIGLTPRDEDLATQQVRETLLGTIVRFERRAGGLPVVPGAVVVQVAGGAVTWVANDTADRPMPAAAPARLAEADAIQAALADLRPRGALRAEPTARRVVSTHRGKPEVVTEVLVPAAEPLGDWVLRVDEAGEVVGRENRMWFATGRVFSPNAVVALRNPELQDQDDADAAVPAEAYTVVELQGLDDSGTLTGEYVSTENTSNRAHEPSGEFHYTRNDKRFEEVMTYHWIDQAQRRFQALGVADANNRRQVLHAHGTTQDNSWYSPASKELTFGDGGVDDAEDAEIIWHEYGHSTQDDQVPGWGSGGHARAMGEAFGDYLAGAMSQVGTDFQLECVGDWDGVSYSNLSPKCLRRLDGTKHFPEDLEGQEHADGEIWSAALWEVHLGMGSSDDTLRLVLAHHFLLAPGATMPEAAEALIQADEQLYAGANRDLIKTVMMNRGILEPTSYVKVTLKDAAGAPVGGTARVEGTDIVFEIPAATGTATRKVAPGSYTLRVNAFAYLVPEARAFQVADDETAALEFALEAAPTGTLTGKVAAATGEALPATLRLAGTPLEPVQAAADGSFTITAPVGSYDLVVSAFGYKVATLEGVAVPGEGVEVALEAVPPFLLVNESDKESYAAFFHAAMTDLGQEFMTTDLPSGAGVGAMDLLPFRTVVWFTGDRYSGIFSDATQAAVREYLAAGGRLVISGQDIGYGIKETPFYAEVLGATYVKDTAGSTQVSGGDLAFSLEGGDGAGNQKYPDVITALEGSTPWLGYGDGSELAALIRDVGEGRVVYLAFGLEGVSTAENRAALLGACFQAVGHEQGARRGLASRWFAR